MQEDNFYINYGFINESIPEVFDNRYYEKTAKEYDAMYKSFMPDNKDASILDIGCGKGFFLYYLKEYGFTNYYGIDADPSSITHTKKYVTQYCEHKMVEDFLLGKQNSYELIVMNEVLEHIEKEKIIPLLKTIKTALNSEGKLICYVPNMENPFTTYTRYHDFTHTIGFTQNSLRMVLKYAGLENIKILEPVGLKKGIKQAMKKTVQKTVLKTLNVFFDYPPNGFIHTSRIIGVAYKKK